jgi:hypothetical protein
MTLPLYGTAEKLSGFQSEERFKLIRVRSADRPSNHAADTALVKTSDDASGAIQHGFQQAIVIGDVGELEHVPNVIYLP